MPQLHRAMIGSASHRGENSVLIGTWRALTVAAVEESRPRRAALSRTRSTRSTSRTRSASTRAPARRSRSSSARSSATGSSRRYEDIQAIFKDPATFSSENTQAPYKPRPPEVQRVLRRGRLRAPTSGLSGRQPPDHTRLRGFINKAFTPRRVADARAGGPRAGRRDDRRASRAAATPTSWPSSRASFPRSVIFRLLGVPDEDVPKVKEWAAEPRAAELRRPAQSSEQVAPRREPRRTTGATASSWSRRASSEPQRRPRRRPRADLPGGRRVDLRSTRWPGSSTRQLTAGHETTSVAARRGPAGAARPSPERWGEICAPTRR